MRVVLAILFYLIFCPSQGQENLRERFLTKMEKSNKEMLSITSDFEQIQELSILAEKQVSSGKFYFLSPDKMKWEQRQPTPYYFIFNGQETKKFDGQKVEQLPSGSPQVLGFRKFLLGTVDGSIFRDDGFENSFSKEGDNIRIEMIPLKKMLKRRFDKISLLFDFEKMILLELVFFESGGDSRAMRFFSHEINGLQDDLIFR